MFVGIGIGIGRNRYGTGGTPVALLLDTYSGAAAAYSLRKLSSSYSGSAIQVRRSSDDATLDVGFVSGELDTSSLETFVNAQDVAPADYGEGAAAAYSLRYVSDSYSGPVIGARRDNDDTSDFTPTQITDGTLATWSQGGNVYVHTWYDQSGNGNDATQSASENQPQIVSGGSVILENGKPSLQFDGSDWMVSSSPYPTQQYLSNFYLASSTTTNERVLDTRGTGSVVQGWHNKFSNTSDITVIDDGVSSLVINGIIRSGQKLVSVLAYGGSGSYINEYTNGSSSGNVSDATTRDFNSGNNLYIATNVNGQDTQTFNGKLQEIVSYTTDQSSNRTNIETEINSYYDIYTSTADGFVTTWYDQSGNANNATQTNAANQPQIVSSGSVILENGKPTIKWDNNDDFLNNSSTFAQPTNYFIASRVFSTAAGRHFIDSVGATNRQIASPSTGTYTMFAGVALDSLIPVSTSSMQLSSYLFKSTNSTISVNSNVTNGDAGTNSISNYQIGKGSGSSSIDGVISEVIIYTSDQSSNRTGIETNINDFYSIYYVATNSEYQDVLDYADSQGYQRPSYAQCALQDALVGDLKNAGIWSKLDLFYVFATDGDRDFAGINFIDPNNYEITEVNSPTFTSNVGFTGDGASAYLETNFNLSTSGVNYTQDDVGLVFGISQLSVIGLGRPYGPSSINNYLSYGPDASRMWINSIDRFNINTFGTTINNQIIFSNRTDASNMNARITDLETPNSNTISSAVASSTLLSGTIGLLRTATRYWELGNTSSLFALGSNLSTSEMDDFETAYYTNYFTNL